MTTAGDLAPFRVRAVDQISEISEGAHQRKRKPIARRLSNANLILDVVRQVRKRVALLEATFRRNRFVAAGKRNRLK